MASATKNAILRALIQGVITDLMVKTSAENVFVDDATTLAAKLSEIIVALNSKATTDALTSGLAGKAASKHTHEQSEINGLSAVLAGLATNEDLEALRQELLGDLPVEAYNTFTELAAYIDSHQDAADALNAAIGKKADASTVQGIQNTIAALGALAHLSVISESHLDSALKAKVNAASEGNHSHSNKALLDTYTQTEANLADAVSKKHSHSNKSVLDGITSVKVSAWDGKSKFYAQTTQPTGLTSNDLWVQIIE